MDEIDEREKYCLDQIRAIQVEYQKAIQPYVDEFVRLRSLRMPSPIVMSMNDFLKSGIDLPNAP